MALVISVEDTESKKTGRFVFARSPIRVGRSELSDLCLPVPSVSLSHGIIRFQNKGIHYVDTGSKNGSALDGERIPNGVSTLIPQGGTVTLGTLHLRMSLDPSAVSKGASEARRSLFGEQRESLDAVAGGTRFLTAPPKLDDLPPPAPEPEPEPEPNRAPLSATRIMRELSGAGPARPAARPAPSPSGSDSHERTVIVSAPNFDDAPPPKRALRESLRAKAAAIAPAAASAPAEDVPLVRTEAVEQLVRSLQEDYNGYRDKFSAMMRSIESKLEGLSRDESRSAFMLMGARYPALLQEWPFRDLGKSHGYDKPPPGLPAAPSTLPSVIASDSLDAMVEKAPAPARARDLGTLKSINQFAEAYAPRSPKLNPGEDVTRFLDRIAQVLEAFAKSFVELRKGQEQFEAEVAVHVGSDGAPLDRAKNLAEVLSYLLEENQETFVRVEELTRAFADIMVHQVALLNGVRAGAKGLLEQLSPEALERQGSRERSNSGLRGVFGRKSLWDRFVERREELLDDETQLSQALLGPEFAKAYTAVAGGAFDEDEDDEG